MLFEKDFNSLTGEDIQKLIEIGVAEDRQIEYKQRLPEFFDSELKEFLADVSAFANASGGMIIFGISEENGLPIAVVGIDVDDFDQLKLRLEQTIRYGIKPRINQLIIRVVEVEGKRIILIRIPNSWSKPHVVNYKKRWRFYIRTSAGKDPMDIEEVRSSMIQTSNLPERIKNFRNERIMEIHNGSAPVPLSSDSPIILHLIPFSALYNTEISPLNFNIVSENYWRIRPLYTSVNNGRFTLEGFLNYGRYSDEGKFNSYVHVYRNGIIESVDTRMLGKYNNEEKSVPSIIIEEEIVKATKIYLDIQRDMGVLPPITIFVSFLNIKGYYLNVGKYDSWGDRKFLLQRKNLLLPETIFEDYPPNVPTALQAMFDSMWNAFGWERSLSYDENGKWNL